MKKVITTPNKKDLNLGSRELLKIKINISSFTVVTQRSSTLTLPETIDVQKHVFPLRYLKEFFLINGKSKSLFIHRSNSCTWAENFSEKKPIFKDTDSGE